MNLPAALLSLTALILGGCAIHPLPEDVTRNTTHDIVEKIRCEGRQALDNISVRLLRTSTDPKTLAFADRVAAGDLTVVDLFDNINLRRQLVLDRDVWDTFETYTLTAVTFDFGFTINEENDNRASADFRLPLVDGLFTLGTGASGKLERRGFRKFFITNSFRELHELRPGYCATRTAYVGNIVYPITGTIGLEEVFETFVRLNKSPGIHFPEKFSDTLTFTTTLNASANPAISLDQISARRLRLANASATFSATRTDEHQVAVNLAKGARLNLGIAQARLGAKEASRIVAEERRTEDFFIVPRRRVIIQ